MKSGFVTIIGRPNVGKSTLFNTLLNFNVAIVSEKPQTTRNDIRGIYNDNDSQIVFIDTPGIHKPKSKFGDFINNKAYKKIKDIDLIIFLTPANEKIGPGDQFIMDKIKSFKNKIAIITKSDLNNDKESLDSKALYLKQKKFKTIITSSIKNPNLKFDIVSVIKKFLKEGEIYYDRNIVTDQPETFFIKEIIRESAISLLKDELPHSIAIVINSYEKAKDIVKIDATIFVERNSQKGIIIGAKAKKIKEIGKKSRIRIQEIINKKVHLSLNVKVEKNWTKNSKKIKEFGY